MLKKLMELMLASSDSGKWKVSLVDFAKVLRAGAFVGVGACLTHVIEHATEYDLGNLEPLVIMGLTAAGEFIFRMKKDNTPKV
jgi:hypothetical protein